MKMQTCKEGKAEIFTHEQNRSFSSSMLLLSTLEKSDAHCMEKISEERKIILSINK